jgi:hypothetical protein
MAICEYSSLISIPSIAVLYYGTKHYLLQSSTTFPLALDAPMKTWN